MSWRYIWCCVPDHMSFYLARREIYIKYSQGIFIVNAGSTELQWRRSPGGRKTTVQMLWGLHSKCPEMVVLVQEAEERGGE